MVISEDLHTWSDYWWWVR